MATIINNPSNDDSGGATGVVIGVLLALLIGGALYMMNVLPFVKRADDSTTIIVPEQVNIDVTAEKQL